MRYLLIVSTLFFLSCQKNSSTASRYQEDGRAKPTVAITPVVDSTISDLAWSLSDELTSLITTSLQKKEGLYLQTNVPPVSNPFECDLLTLSKEYKDSQFVVFLELLDHSIAPVETSKSNPPSNLDMCLRIRVVDLRGKKPSIILQEQIKDSYYLSRNFLLEDYSRTICGTEAYKGTPMAIAHQQFAKDISERIQDYIWISQNRF